MNKRIESTFLTESIRIELNYKYECLYAKIDSGLLTPIKDINLFIKENARLLGEEEINFIVGFHIMVEKQKSIGERNQDNLNNLISSISKL
ncbi:hypothetical protein [Salegentibacter sp. Hel_I_6]|uniref:hypothetical protein n=1 Tax=Salegentibacter sp. Hel_I_6 TaxID=1250278 RepID=UPI00055EEBE1|nr:hypothetical protein [Salegentibacter sp. Hel_I_6]